MWPSSEADTESGGESVQTIVRRLRQEHRNNSHRPITLLLLRNVFTRCNEAGITQLVYLLGRHFRLCSHDNREYGAELPLSACRKHQLALLKGLGFNHLLLSINDFGLMTSTKTVELKIAVDPALLHAFQFKKVSIVLGNRSVGDHLPGTKGEDDEYRDTGFIQSIDTIMNLIAPLNPDRIIHSQTLPSKKSSGTATGLFSRQDVGNQLPHRSSALLSTYLYKKGYYDMGRGWFVRSEDELIQPHNSSRLKYSAVGYNCVNVEDIITFPIHSAPFIN